MSNLKFVTATGADDSVGPSTLVEHIGKEMSRHGLDVEIGVLWGGPSEEGGGRFPGLKWLRDLETAAETSLGPTFSLHLCGWAEAEFVRRVADGAGHTNPDEILRRLGFPFSRMYSAIQLNRALGRKIPGKESLPGLTVATRHLRLRGATLRAQVAAVTTAAVGNAIDATAGLGQILVDSSGGRGRLPAKWPHTAAYGGLAFGYAGGLKPANLGEQLPRIAEAAGRSFFVDMESGLRDNCGNFCLELCSQALAACAEFARSGAAVAEAA